MTKANVLFMHLHMRRNSSNIEGSTQPIEVSRTGQFSVFNSTRTAALISLMVRR